MKFLVSFTVVLCFFTLIQCEKARYDNYRVYSIHPENDEHLQLLRDLEDQYSDFIFFKCSSAIVVNFDVVVPPHRFAFIREWLGQYNMRNEIKFENFQRLEAHCHRYVNCVTVD